MKTFAKTLFACVLTIAGHAATAQSPEMADTFRAEGKIYVVVAIILIVLAGLITYLFLLDRKISRLEKMIHVKKQTKQRDKSF